MGEEHGRSCSRVEFHTLSTACKQSFWFGAATQAGAEAGEKNSASPQHCRAKRGSEQKHLAGNCDAKLRW